MTTETIVQVTFNIQIKTTPGPCVIVFNNDPKQSRPFTVETEDWMRYYFDITSLPDILAYGFSRPVDYADANRATQVK